MFKRTKSILVLALIAAMCVSMAACGEKNNQSASIASNTSVISASSDSTSSSSQSSVSESSVSESSVSESSVSESSVSESSVSESSNTSASESSQANIDTSSSSSSSSQSITVFKTMGELVHSEYIQKQIAALKKSNSATMNVEVKADNDYTLTYEYKFSKQIKDTSNYKTQIEKQLSIQSKTFENIANQMATVVSCKQPIVVVVRFLNADGTVIFEKSYKQTKTN